MKSTSIDVLDVPYIRPWVRRTATDNEVKYDPEISETLRSNFYVDDLLKSVKDEEIAVTWMKDVKAFCAEGGFHLTK